MKTTFFLSLIWLYSNLIYSQNIKVYDAETNIPIPFVTVICSQNDIHTESDYCDENGFILLKRKSFNKIVFSCIGYESKSIDDISLNEKVFLKKKIFTLDEVVISNKKNSYLLLGYSNEKKAINLSGSKGFEICEFIENPNNEEKKVKSFLFKIRRKSNFKTAIRIHFYKKMDYKIEPSDEILLENIIHYFDGKTKGLIEVDVSKYNIELPPEGAFVGIEWLGILDENGNFLEDKENWNDTSIDLNDEIAYPYTFIKSRIRQNTWLNTENLKKDIGKFKNYPNASFGIKIFE